MTDTFKVQINDKFDGKRFVLTVAPNGHILSSTRDVNRATQLSSAQLEKMSEFVVKRKLYEKLRLTLQVVGD